jgi:predicted amidohydrolase YtcJ
MRPIALLLALLSLTLSACPSTPKAPPPPPADLVLRGGVVFSAVADAPLAQALAVRGGRIVFVGSNDDALAHVGETTRVVSLQGRFVMPGLVDGHVHPLRGGQMLTACSLGYEALTRSQLRERVAACLAAEPDAGPDDWLEVFAWQAQAIVPAGARITKKTLDRIDTQRPIYVQGADGHTGLANSRALELAGVTATTLDPHDGKFLRDKSGVPNGYLLDGASDIIESAIPPLTTEKLREHLAAAHRNMLALGVTAYLAAAVPPEQLVAWSQPSAAPQPRAHLALLVDAALEREPALVAARLRGIRDTLARDDLRIGTVKFFLDGVMEHPAQTAALLSPYLGGGEGELYADPTVLARLAIKLEAEGWQLHFHAIGDRAVRTALDAIEAARKTNGPKDVRHTLVHLELIDRHDIPRFAALGAIASFSPQWHRRDSFTIDALEPYIGSARHERLYPVKTLLDSGAHIAYGSDWPVDPPDRFDAIESGVTRERAIANSGTLPGVLGADQRLTTEQALRAYSAGAAYQLRRDGDFGTLTPGKLADFIVLNANPLALEPRQISELAVLETYIGGVRVYEAPPAP